MINIGGFNLSLEIITDIKLVDVVKMFDFMF